MRIDLHTHSTASDGTQAPEELIHAAADAGLDVVAITDHDTTAGWAAAIAAARRRGIGLVRGTEVSAKSTLASVHILAYLHDPAHPDLVAAMEMTRTSRLTRARAMVDRLAADLPVTWDDIQAQASADATIGRPHIADALVAAGVVGSRSQAFDTLLSPRGPYYVPHAAPSATDAVRAVLAAGGVPVLAHPAAHARGRVLTDDAIAELADAGLAGLEVHHRDHTAADRERLAALARGLDLFVTGSSDYHGQGKPNRLGENTTHARVLAIIEERGTLDVIRPARTGRR